MIMKQTSAPGGYCAGSLSVGDVDPHDDGDDVDPHDDGGELLQLV